MTVRIREGAAPETLFAALHALLERDPDRVLLRNLEPDRTWTRKDFAEATEALAGALNVIVPGPYTAGLLMGNRPEYFISDMAVLLSEGVPVSLYPTASAEQLRYVIENASISVLFVERAKLDTLLVAASGLKAIRAIVIVDDNSGLAATTSDGCPLYPLSALMWGIAPKCPVIQAIERAQPDELLTLIYTSGTTGNPKGVLLSHRNLLAAACGIGSNVGLEDGDRIISWLPHAHVAERTCSYVCALLFGLEVIFCEDAQTLSQLLRKVEPDWFGAFPRFWEKLKSLVEDELAKHPDQEYVRQALADGLDLVRLKEGRGILPEALSIRVAAADAALFAPLRSRLGLSRAKSLCTGSAPISAEILEFFSSIGLPIGEMYGASETCTYGAMYSREHMRIGSVGKCAPGMQLAIAADGEILLRGEAVMQGYHKAPEKDAEVFTRDGMYRTGDLGRIDEDGYLWVTGRKKELIINSSGQNMSPAYIEAIIKSHSSLIGQVCVIGDRRPFNTALIALDLERARACAGDIAATLPLAELARHPAVEVETRRGVGAGNSRLARVEQIKRFFIVQEEWGAGGDEVTPTLKLRRDRIAQKYSEILGTLYAGNLVAPCLAPLMANQIDQ
ncbi:AMP-dependent synthetase/ligase [Pseudomonas aeruginosa]|uniref:AMP-dependent synthetase/ligase n=1 Tax=Pseudomonas aeruginosa TaxID=287 RepID=UPI0018C1E53F|nr:AMP-binding protein [Pseudomonas aeruginosa]QPP31167.1 AMP-binding protein [Pseudomonas aeruginosa]